jgi:hypothetical protein
MDHCLSSMAALPASVWQRDAATPADPMPVTCVYRAYEDGDLVATGRLTLDALPTVGDVVQLNGRPHVVRSVDFGDGEHVLELIPY